LSDWPLCARSGRTKLPELLPNTSRVPACSARTPKTSSGTPLAPPRNSKGNSDGGSTDIWRGLDLEKNRLHSQRLVSLRSFKAAPRCKLMTRDWRSALLSQRYCWWQALNRTYLRDRYLMKESAGVRRDGLEIAALNFSVQCYKTPSEFAGSGNTVGTSLNCFRQALRLAVRPSRGCPLIQGRLS